MAKRRADDPQLLSRLKAPLSWLKPPEEGLWSDVQLNSLYAEGLRSSPLGWPYRSLTGQDGPSLLFGLELVEALAEVDSGLVFALPGPGLAGPAIHRLVNAAERRRYVDPLFESPPRWGALALSELALGSDARLIRTTAERVGPNYLLNGNKSFVLNLPQASWVLVFATLDPDAGPEAHRAFVLPTDLKGLSLAPREPQRGLRGVAWADLRLQRCLVDMDALLGNEAFYRKRGLVAMRPPVDAGGVLTAGMMLGLGRRVQHWLLALSPSPELAEAKRSLEAAALETRAAASLFDRGEDQSLRASLAKLGATRAVDVLLSIAEIHGCGSFEARKQARQEAIALELLEGSRAVRMPTLLMALTEDG